MPATIDPRAISRQYISPDGPDGMSREGGLTQTASGWDTVSFQRGPSYRSIEVANPAAQTMDNTKLLLIAAGVLAAAWFISRS